MIYLTNLSWLYSTHGTLWGKLAGLYASIHFNLLQMSYYLIFTLKYKIRELYENHANFNVKFAPFSTNHSYSNSSQVLGR